MREVYIQLNCYGYPPRKTGALRRSRSLFIAPDFLKLFSGAASNEGRLEDGLSKEKCFFLPQQDSLALASFFSSGTQIDCNKGDQAYHAPQHIAHLLPHRHQRCGKLCGVQPHQQLMMQQWLHQTNTPVFI